ncbi:MAG: alpha/beta hydrolase [Phycisphaerae bacterium]|nr:alpha/beta hydrolase [Phycisphaerae bacterium]
MTALARLIVRCCIAALILATGTAGSGGCARKLMATPAIAQNGLIDPFQYVPPKFQATTVPVFVASTRTVSGNDDPARYYTAKRSPEVRLGLATVDLAVGQSWQELLQESRTLDRKTNPTLKLVSYQDFGPLWTSVWPTDYRFHRQPSLPNIDRGPAERCVKEMNALLDASRRKQITIFVHGFNTFYEDNLFIAAEFWHFMGHDGVIMSFDWPSAGSLFSYQVDKANADFSQRQFRELLEFLGANTTATSINILAHSAGGPIVAEALRQLSLKYYDLDDSEIRRRLKIGRVVLAAPDLDSGSAISAAVDGAGRVTQGVALYASKGDIALNFSSGIFGSTRLGDSIGKLPPDLRDSVIRNKLEWVDATAAKREFPTFLGHSYFYDNPWVSSDIMLFMALGANQDERGLVRDEKTGFLVFPKDYAAKMPAIAADLIAKYPPRVRAPDG